MSPFAMVSKLIGFVDKLPIGTVSHIVDFVEALVNKDEDAAKRAATSAATSALWAAPVKK